MTRAILSSHDVSELKLAQEERDAALARLQQAHDLLEEQVKARTADLARTAGELARSNALLLALNGVALRIQATLDPDGILNTLGSELGALGLYCTVLLLGADGQPHSLRCTAVGATAVPDSERSDRQSDRAVPDIADLPWLAEVAERRRALFVRDGTALEVTPDGATPTVAWRSAGPAGETAGHVPMACLPLEAEGRPIGVLVVSGTSLAEGDLPALSALAGQVAVSFERARLAAEADQASVLREVSRLRSELIANVSHEMRTPLGLIEVLCTSLLAEDVEHDAETRRSFLIGIRDATERLAVNADNLLHLSRAEEGRLEVHARPTDLGRLAAGVVSRAQIQAPRHQIRCAIDPLQHVAIVDPEQIERLLNNLVGNAVKYSPGGGQVVVALEWKAEELVLSVSDEGIGVAEDDRERIFDRFYRAESEVGRRAGGVGLGLAVCRTISEAHGGRIWVENRPEGGSTFFISLPAAGPGSERRGTA